MVDAIDLKRGMAFEKDGKLIKVLETNHHKPGKGNTVMQMKLYDVRSGSIVQTTMRPTERVEMAILESKDAQFLYLQDEIAYFMDLETYEQYELSEDSIKDELLYLLPNTNVKIEFYGTEVIGIDLPSTVTLTVTETSPSIKGGSVTGGGKPATMETGLVVNVPDFIKAGEKLIINTDKGTYSKRATD
ncbi:elongation factor P [Lacticaseibacillus sharpeae]|uniref:Elongation factor P n=1 Tax=Lacticaseibacillus sharpeae JCM 1186 = DSM 20505 TaxID=1291052 RepID=A0A0R1ZWR9_9LACO|nr:elongation factor P [Lacticaseibacillus sharpeae]KRM56297.1 translation initiation factor 5A (eIF-5A) [Lacticaseibacillus sharpeae JCM 1186 = DSM 20505]